MNETECFGVELFAVDVAPIALSEELAFGGWVIWGEMRVAEESRMKERASS